ncbi:dTDP-3-amino-3,4,6-trideoxy-alpha-D-glucopyranose [Novipirellula aureliae]|uniref:dTDP-3-amino-3,4, 6-trideoxy-alpha-D-glucopyranose n=1 Tax=Novipirellula aureliae TaxID=2527966 RepID=A0A5C6E216_9BACT|nr:class I SAM-dependent methyltransferase [Novipirellula aureliae]TWU41189.1 dTDP-3-amino-3,4,6-trideoxy-alpha-D-glucopyranose [Novipirellula aureliae]
MSNPFNAYGRYYDLLYQDKDYVAESNYIRSLVDQFAKDAKEILELGCGTAKHACLLAQSGLDVTGIERSDEMLAAGKSRIAECKATSARVRVIKGDARDARLNLQFDCVLSLFHVVSYQITNADVLALFQTAYSHLADGGIFVFDVWYGPAVLMQRPSTRVKRMENVHCDVLRIAEPTLDVNRNRVDVDYTMIVTDKTNGCVERLKETHSMRYFFTPELELIANRVGLNIIHSEQWMDGEEPSADTWGVTFIAKKGESIS